MIKTKDYDKKMTTVKMGVAVYWIGGPESEESSRQHSERKCEGVGSCAAATEAVAMSRSYVPYSMPLVV